MELNFMLAYGAAEPSIRLLQKFKILEILLPFHVSRRNEISFAFLISKNVFRLYSFFVWASALWLQAAYLTNQTKNQPTRSSIMLMVRCWLILFSYCWLFIVSQGSKP